MNASIESLVRPNIRTLTPYRSARQDHSSGILLDANENSFGSVVEQNGVSLSVYPDPFQRELRAKIAAMNTVDPENLFVGVGSDEIIDLLLRIFCDPDRDSILVIEPTYGMYRVSAAINGINVISSLLTKEFQINVADVLAKAERAKLIFCCSPNNPTSNLLRIKDVRALCSDTNAMVVVDEAYIDFADGPSLIPLTREFPQLILLRTFSKAWGLAGIRLGYCFADASVIGYLMKIKPPYNINTLTSHCALRALEEQEAMKRTVRSILVERNFLTDALRRLPNVAEVFPSDANFLLVRFADAQRVLIQLRTRGIIVRDRSSEPTLENCLRITVGTRDQNAMLMQALEEQKS